MLKTLNEEKQLALQLKYLYNFYTNSFVCEAPPLGSATTIKDQEIVTSKGYYWFWNPAHPCVPP